MTRIPFAELEHMPLELLATFVQAQADLAAETRGEAVDELDDDTPIGD